MGNCRDCGRNSRRGCKADCPRDKTVTKWVRYRRRAKLKAEQGEEAAKHAGE